MFTNIRKHQKWLWVLISAAVIISFVVYFNPQVQQGGAITGSTAIGSIYGEEITRDQYTDAHAEASIFHFINYGRWPEQDENARELGIDVKTETRNRLFLARKLKQSNIVISDSAVADWIATSFADRETKGFRKEVYDNFMNILRQRGYEPRDFERFVRHQVGYQHLAALAAIPGKLVPPQEIEQEFREQNQKADTVVAFVIATNFLSKVQVTDEELGKFYSNRISAYYLPERLQLAYVAFPASNYLAAADQQLSTITNMSQRIDAIYIERGTNFFTDALGQVLTPEAAKEKIREEVRLETAKVEARKVANALAEKVQDDTQVNTNTPSAALARVAAASNLQLQISEPFSQFEDPPGLNLPADVARNAFSLSPEEPNFAEPIVGEDTVYVMALHQRIPRQLQELATIREKVVEDYKMMQSRTMATEAGRNFTRSITNVTSGDDFAQKAVEAGLTIMNLPPFTKGGPNIPELEMRQDGSTIRNAAFNIKAGTAGTYMPSRDGGFVVFVEKVTPPADQEIKEGLQAFADTYRRQKAGAAFSDWFQAEMRTAQMMLAGDERREGPEGGQ